MAAIGRRARSRAGASAAALMLLAGVIRAQSPAPPPQRPDAAIAATYAETCAGCHGSDARGGRGPALLDPRLLAQLSDRQIHDTVMQGVPGSEMPAFKDVLGDDRIWQMVAYLRTHAAALQAAPAFVPDPDGRVIRTARQAVRIHVVAKGLSTPWGLAWLPDGRMLVTERPGRLRIVTRDGRLLPDAVRGTPKVWERQDSGLLDVAVDPDYARNGWIYLAYAEVVPGHVVTAEEAATPTPGRHVASPPSMTVVVRGRISRDGRWIDNQELFRAPPALYTASGAHYGCRFLFDGHGHLFFSLGERGDMTDAQRLDSPLGKIHRINDDGTVPPDNPFAHTPGAVPTIWSYGHRNPEGLAFDPATGLLWESEHGPMGGDELNIIAKGHNYGWGVVSMGIQPGITKRDAPGMDPPIAYWTPAIAPSGIGFYAGTRYPGWTGSLFVAGLVGQQLRRIAIEGRSVVSQEIIFHDLGRTRAVRTGPDGLLYVLVQTPTAGFGLSDPTPGMVIRLEPLK
ncbi:PQQ-dependent sugar dehydrogenase [Sphingomonas nostoxanthinifaciens]|uniref:PQQ-dependent sugar dehydrogenase n=1 Tax=Sphingomonas nostoxanthinifaciens TaxID=2872652 RepID=UPI001CC206BC|nr:PQQ-dependent sugar dehydrogenase [Sphingomonas nostoxanthinifaciens]UAK24781.1 PQQ-dependent sugar dehydrogenase [Sphingomonas nostoxanthinifaciens]